MAERIFGHIDNVFVGDVFVTRLELAFAKVHPPTQAGISGSSKIGADSIVLSDGYEDDEDTGDEIIYTGEGGRDPSNGKQVTDQFLSRRNLALAKSKDSGLPVRVSRRIESGYRYDGLYRVVDYWHEIGKAGFVVWRYRLKKMVDYPIPSSNPDPVMDSDDAEEYNAPQRVESTVIRIVRDTAITKELKKLYDFKCQVCGTRLESATGPYAEAAHIKPLGKPHNGPDVAENLLCLCPNHHVLFDRGGFSVNKNLELIGLEGKLTVNRKHNLSRDFLEYHKNHYLIQTDKD